MQLDYLREFLVLQKSSTFQQAADELYISQSTLTRHIQSIEKELGVELYDRSGLKAALTEKGRRFVEYARQIIEAEDAANAHFLNKLNPKSMPVKVLQYPELYLITELILAFSASHPDLHIELQEEIFPDTEPERNIKVAFLREHNHWNCNRSNRILWSEDSIVAVVPQEHPLAGRKAIGLEELQDSSLVMMPRLSTSCDLIYQRCRESGFELHAAFEVHNIFTAAEFVKKGGYIALLYESVARHLPSDDVVVVPILPDIRNDIYFFYPEMKSTTVIEKEFVSFVKNFRSGQEK